ncbi:MAG TPA: hypothetical protein VGQ57_05200, partial [Polyangiaceae bacterium]|nr:hypothetical protein [Polyangiaceae bacterium]
ETELTRAVNRNLLRDEVRHARLGFGFLAQLTPEDRSLVEHALPKLVETTLAQWLDPSGYPEIPPGHGCLPHDELVETVVSALGDLTLPGFEEAGIRTREAQALLSRASHFGRRSTLPADPSLDVMPK